MAEIVPYQQLAADAASIIGDTVYATMTTVDKLGRPRSRVLIVAWELERDDPIGWLATHKTPVKAAHLARNQHVSTSYWTPEQNVVSIDSVATWDDEAETASKVWNLYRWGSPPGNGYNPGHYWTGPSDPKFHVLRLSPWRIQVLTADELASGLPYRQSRFDSLNAPSPT